MTSTIQNDGNRGAALTSSAALEAFRGDIKPSELSLLYKAGVGCVAFAMILLPGIYLAVIAVAAYGVFWHLTQNAYFLHGGAGFARFVAYFVSAVEKALAP